MPEPVLIKSLPGQQVLALREVAPQPAALPARLEAITKALKDHAISPQTPAGIALYHRPPGEGGTVDVGVPVASAQISAHIDPLTLPDGQTLTVREAPYIQIAACLLHRGDYAHLPDTRAVLTGWIEDNGYQITGPGRMVYLNIPGDTSPAELLTELQYPVIKTRRKKKKKK